ncbi:agmatine deiminase family protein [Alkalitalea saponilacus]|uniref:Agmatine/peptidylarginine deiminase n=1 Tax=Alkalitalea saponilacus TaxID=889453 RepID=A0A1T5HT80_9BACT|nr:agmatine deiminase family protein [Alkalitalea saponilacus]ASB49245.1 agmatine deiminase [Alkalitalea saponilacus]SKC23731.1 Agmatine/peptidylarginine deiminase [Alkalitalea saponilacus]
MTTRHFPAEWAPQSAILMAWPHKNTDWDYMLEEVQVCFSEIIKSILPFEKVLLLVPDEPTGKALSSKFGNNLITIVTDTNDTWARDFGPIIIFEDNKPVCLDFKFNGWGLKFAADKDNLITGSLFRKDVFAKDVRYKNRLNFVLEGGALESDGEGTLLTTSECLLSPNRNGEWNKEQIEGYLIQKLGLKRVLWINNGYLAGDDTDSHIDTLARFCNPDTIAYVKCSDASDEHFQALKAMEEELIQLRKADGEPYQLIPLPMAKEVFFHGERLPATYANFLIINHAVLVPTYGSELDIEALSQLKKAFPDREIIGINCLPLIKQHGSLHCVTMQLPVETI